MNGKVYLVGAGPSDAGLMTLKGKWALERADVVVCDALVGDAILAMIPSNAERIYVGKRAGCHTKTQAEINQILVEQAQMNKTVVRLQGGDPFLFGRGGEELELLEQNGIPYEVVPGITSALAVPAYNGIPVTHRDYSASVHIFTGHRKEGTPLDLDFDAMARLRGTLVFLMGVTALPEICAGLLRSGMSPETPAALLHRGTSAQQKRVVSTLAELPEAAKALEAPSILVIGPVCSLSGRFAWAEKRPLFGQRYLVTRPRARASALTERLRALGGEVIEFPTIRLQPIPAVDLSMLKDSSWLVLTSPSGVEIFLDLLKQTGKDTRSLAHLKIAVLGGGTARRLADFGLLADLVPSTYDAASLGEALASRLHAGDRVFLARARRGNPDLPARLSRLPGVEVIDQAIYETEETAPPWLRPETFWKGPVWAVFTSASTVQGFASAAGEDICHEVRALCIGRQTEAQAQALGMKTRVSQAATINSLVELALDCAWEEKYGIDSPPPPSAGKPGPAPHGTGNPCQ